MQFKIAYSQNAYVENGLQSERISYVKTSIFPSAFATLFRPQYLWLTLDYERQLKPGSRFTINAVLDYRNLTSETYVNGALVATIPDNIDFYIRPQLRYYTGKIQYKGFYGGAFPLYLYRDKPSDNIKGHYWGAGLVTGYQIFLSRKYPMEVYGWIAWQSGNITTIDNNSLQSIQIQDTFVFGLIQLNIGLPIKGRSY
jgi:hypothetical protein